MGLVLAAAGALVVVGMRFGLLTLTVFFLVVWLFVTYPPESDLSSWHAQGAALTFALVAALAASAFLVSLASRPLFRLPEE